MHQGAHRARILGAPEPITVLRGASPHSGSDRFALAGAGWFVPLLSFDHLRVGMTEEAYGYATRRSGRPQAKEGPEPPRADVRLARVDHRVGVALRCPVRLTDRGARCDNRVGSRRLGDAATGARPRRAREHVPGGGGFGPLSSLLLREHRRVRDRVDIVGRDLRSGAHPGPGHAAVSQPLLPVAHLHDGRRDSPDGAGHRSGRGADGPVHGHKHPWRGQPG
jgi:hypothetical protein